MNHRAADRRENPMDGRDLGSARITSSKLVVAGELTTVDYEYRVGHPIDETGYVMIAFRFASDFGTPQWVDRSAPDYCRIETSGQCRLEPRWDPKGYRRPWGRVLLLKVMGGYLDRGDQVRVIFGDTSGGSPGWRMQTFCEKTFEFKTLVDPIATYQFYELARSPEIRIVPGEGQRTVVIAPSRVEAGRPFEYRVKQEDRWGNPVARAKRLKHPGFPREGVHRIAVHGLPNEGEVLSNPIEATAEVQANGLFWADLHGQSEETVGTNSIRDYFLFARDYGCVDIAAHQGNDFQMTDEFWETLNHLTASLNRDGRFVVFPGYEWSGNTPLGGDRNVWFSSEGGPIYRSSLELVPGGLTRWKTAATAEELFRLLKTGKEPEAFCAAHVGGRYADLRFHDRTLELAVEIHSAWGTFEWMIQEAFKRGYRVAFFANSDGHKGRPGASYPGAGKFGSIGGLTCVLADALDRKSVLSALKARHCYATTGHRPLLSVELMHKGNRIAMMGDVIQSPADGFSLAVKIEGTHALERVEIWNGLERVRTLKPDSADPACGKRFLVSWGGAEVRGRARLVNWDGILEVRGNSIESFVPVNFYNPERSVIRESATRLHWKSNTTGGRSGVIVTLKNSRRGELLIETVQRSSRYRMSAEQLRNRRWGCGGVNKELEVRPLPNEPGESGLNFQRSLGKLRRGDNPIYIRVVQEDGHLAWSSPITIVH